MTLALLIGPEERAAVKELRVFAHASPLSTEMLERFAKGYVPGQLSTVDTDWRLMSGQYAMELPVGWRVTYTHELQPVGRCHHISIACSRCAPDNRPGIEAVVEILALFGMPPITESISVYKELTSGAPAAASIIALVQPDWEA